MACTALGKINKHICLQAHLHSKSNTSSYGDVYGSDSYGTSYSQQTVATEQLIFCLIRQFCNYLYSYCFTLYLLWKMYSI